MIGLKRTSVLLCSLLVANGLLGHLPAQGPGPVGYRQASIDARTRVVPESLRLVADSVRVKPNHWKRGALIGFVATALPVAISAAAGGCGGWVGEGGSCAITKAAITLSVGALGGLVGGLVGSFFPKEEPDATGR